MLTIVAVACMCLCVDTQTTRRRAVKIGPPNGIFSPAIIGQVSIGDLASIAGVRT